MAGKAIPKQDRYINELRAEIPKIRITRKIKRYLEKYDEDPHDTHHDNTKKSESDHLKIDESQNDQQDNEADQSSEEDDSYIDFGLESPTYNQREQDNNLRAQPFEGTGGSRTPGVGNDREEERKSDTSVNQTDIAIVQPAFVDEKEPHELILFVEILGITGTFRKYTNGKVATVDDHPFMIKSIITSTALSLFKAIDRVKHQVGSKEYEEKSCLDYSNLTTNLIRFDFRAAGMAENPFSSFLQNNLNCGNIAEFLELYNRFFCLVSSI